MRGIPIAPCAEGNTYNPPCWQVFGEDEVSARGQTRIPWRCCGRFDALTAEETVPGTHLCLLLRSRQTEPVAQAGSQAGSQYEEIFLILEPVDDPGSGKYRRVGLGRLIGDTATFDGDNRVILELV